jgi:hypothetical protein
MGRALCGLGCCFWNGGERMEEETLSGGTDWSDNVSLLDEDHIEEKVNVKVL